MSALNKSIFIILLVVVTQSCQPKYQKIPLPSLTSADVPIRIAYAINPRLNHMSDRQLKILLNEAKKTAWEHFSVNLQFSPIKKISIEDLFKTVPKELIQKQLTQIYDFKGGNGDKKAVVKSMVEGLKVNKTTLENMIKYAKPYLVKELSSNSIEALAEALVDTMIVRIKQWQIIKAVDGNPVIDDSLYNEWAIWEIMGYGELDYDVVLTNQLIASIENYGQSIHSAIRGGIVAGTTTYSKNSQYGSFIFWTTFLYSKDSEIVKNLRGNRSYGTEEAARLSGAYLVHEIGHQLFHFSHPYEKKECVMSPVELLKFHQWYRQLDANSCKIGSSAAMQPGSYPFFYRNSW